jgi:SAM-dependent methyltransferase
VDDGSLDFILCTEALEHVYDTRHFLAEARRCLARSGQVLFTMPFAARWHYIPYDYWRFTPSSLKSILTEAGFSSVAVYARGNAVTVACYKVMALILPLLLPQGKRRGTATALRLIGILFMPAFFILAACGNLSLRGRGGDDCLGYTVVAEGSERQ